MTNELPTKTFIVTEVAKTYTVKANSEQHAIDLVNSYDYSPQCPQCEGRFFECECVIEHDEPDTFAELLSCEGCPECETNGFHSEETVTTTKRTIEQVKAENLYNGVRLAIDYLEDINLLTGANALCELLEVLDKERNLPEWQQSEIVEVVEFVKAWK